VIVLDALVAKDSGWICKHKPGVVECHRRLEFKHPPDFKTRIKVARYLASDTPDWRDLNPTWQGAWGSVQLTEITDTIWSFHCVMEVDL
jgi:hypothetical protein